MKNQNVYFKPVKNSPSSSFGYLESLDEGLVLDIENQKNYFAIDEENFKLHLTLNFYFQKIQGCSNDPIPKTFKIFNVCAELIEYNKKTNTLYSTEYRNLDNDFLNKKHTISKNGIALDILLNCEDVRSCKTYNNVKLTKQQINSLIDFSLKIQVEFQTNKRYGEGLIELNAKIDKKHHKVFFIEDQCHSQLEECQF